MNETTKRVLMYVIQFKLEHWGNSPDNREIMDGVGLSSTSVVSYHLDKLYASGHLIKGPSHAARMIGVPGMRIEWIG